MKDRTVIKLFFRGWCLNWESELSICQLFITYFFVHHFFKGVDPTVSNTIRKLFFLSPDNTFWQIRFKCFTNYPFLHTLSVDHLIFWVDTHCNVHEFFIQKRNPTFNTPSGQGLVSS